MHAHHGCRELGRGPEPSWEGYLGLSSCQLTPGHRSDPPPPIALSKSGFNKGCRHLPGTAGGAVLAHAANERSPSLLEQPRSHRTYVHTQGRQGTLLPQPQHPPLAAQTPHEQRWRGRDPEMSSVSPTRPQGLWGEDPEGAGESSASPSRGHNLPQPRPLPRAGTAGGEGHRAHLGTNPSLRSLKVKVG